MIYNLTRLKRKEELKMKNIKNLSLEEKIKMINDNDKMYLEGYIDRALKEFKEKRRKKLASY